jgi:hypothetical protein
MGEKSVGKSGSNFVTVVLGSGLILLGILFLFGRFVNIFFDLDIGHYAWPFFIISPGLLIFMVSFVLERKAGVTLAIFGGMLATIGVILLVQNTFDLYASWAYAWALVAPTSIGLAKLVYGALRGMGDQVKSGLSLAGIGFAIFIFAGFFFELVIGISGFHFGVAWLCWPGLLIGLGIIVLFSNFFLQRRHSSA